MAPSAITDLRKVREALGKSQSQMAWLLGVSTRAVQSYEQGWRPPSHLVQRFAVLLLYLSRREGAPKLAPCWEARKCSPELRAKCPAYELGAGDLCWLIPGPRCKDNGDGRWERKIDDCEDCAVMQAWLGE